MAVQRGAVCAGNPKPIPMRLNQLRALAVSVTLREPGEGDLPSEWIRSPLTRNARAKRAHSDLSPAGRGEELSAAEMRERPYGVRAGSVSSRPQELAGGFVDFLLGRGGRHRR
jgi:hypothetical protein